ncbi:MAG TPA: TolC family protein [Anaeromyxobacteraceae bacterium]|nr:TolC family protein [Anaeromyxobacteraceae bacterium]
MTPLLAILLAAAAADPLTLDAALARAADHPRMSEVRAAAGQASAGIDQARAGYLPTANALATYLPAQVDNGKGVPGAAAPVNAFYSSGIVVTQPIWDFGRTRGQVRSATLAEEATTSDLRAALRDVELNVRSAYYGVLAAEELVRVAKDAEKQMKDHLALAKASFEVGRRSPFDVARAEVDVASARIAIIQAESGVATARSALSAAIGEDVGWAPLERPAEEQVEDMTPARAAEVALAQRPELSALELRLGAQRAAVSSARSAFYPVVTAVGQLGWQGAQMSRLGASQSWQVGVTVSVPLLAGGGDAARVHAQQAAFVQLASQKATLALGVRAEAEQASLAVSEAKARMGAADVLQKQAQDNLALAEGRYQAGVGSIIELSDAQSSLTAARGQRVRAGFDLASARARLARSVGTPSAIGVPRS